MSELARDMHQHFAACCADLARRVTEAVLGTSAQALDEAEESDDDDDVDISDVSYEEDTAHGEDWNKALPHFSTRPRTQRHRALQDLNALNLPIGGRLFRDLAKS